MTPAANAGGASPSRPRPDGKTIRILAVPVEGPSEVRRIPDTLEAQQAEVGGYIEYVHFSAERTGLRLVADEDGRAKRLPANPRATQLYGSTILGNVFVLRVAGSGSADLTDADLKALGVTPPA